MLDKPPGLTSHDGVQIVRRLYGTRRVGHAGTLDPAARGVLVFGLGQATRLLQYVSGCDKAYRGQILLGVETDSYDEEGQVIATRDAQHLTADLVEAALAPFRGTIPQIPPMASAKQVEGQRLHRLYRQGKEIKRQAVSVRVDRFELLHFTPGSPAVAEVEVECGAGTYIRSLAHDLGAALGTGGHLRHLVRTRVDGYTLDEALTPDELAELSPEDRLRRLHGPERAVAHLPQATVLPAARPALAMGQRLDPEDFAEALPTVPGPWALVDPSGHLLAIAEPRDEQVQPRRVFAGEEPGE